jgi:hypothetical protein
VNLAQSLRLAVVEGSRIVEALADALARALGQLVWLKEHPVGVPGVLARAILEQAP